MLYIQKKTPSYATQQELTRVKASPAWRAIANDDTVSIRNQFDLLEKSTIRSDLLIEQHHLCAYCMRRIKNDGSSTHIEHWKPLSKEKESALDYNNFLAVCDGGSGAAVSGRRILCCDAHKGDTEELLVDPRNEAMMNCITYTRNGLIQFVNNGTYSQDALAKIVRDINVTLQLNGKLDVNNNVVQDTSTQIVKGRRDAWMQAEAIVNRLKKDHRFSSHSLSVEIRKIENADPRFEYAGVILFRLKRYYESLRRQGM